MEDTSSGAARPRRLREWAARALLASVGLGIGLVTAELALRMVRPQAALIVPNAMYKLDEESGVLGLRPGFRGTVTNRVEFSHDVAINDAGLRGPAIDRASEHPNILVLGDSFMFGIGVEDDETLAAQLAVALGDAGTPADAFNLGIPGFGVPDSLERFEQLAPALDPDLVVLAIFTGNDLQEAANPEKGVRRGLIRRGRNIRSAGVMEWLYYRSHLFVFLKTAVPTRAYEQIRGALGLGESARVKRLRREIDVHRVEPTEVVARGREATDRALEQLVARAAEHGAEVVAFIIPTILQTDPEGWRHALEQLELDPERYDRHAPTRVFSELLASHGIPALDLTAPMAEARARGESVYFPVDRHWTPAGHRLAARLLAAFLAERGLPADDDEASETTPA